MMPIRPEQDGPGLNVPTPALILGLLANEIRIEVLTALGKGQKSVGMVAQELGLDPSTISHALKALRKAGLVTHTVVKKQHIYRLTERVRTTFHDSGAQIEIVTSTGRILIENSSF
jgi:DNA-binding transcriptional ArsR family regulator